MWEKRPCHKTQRYNLWKIEVSKEEEKKKCPDEKETGRISIYWFSLFLWWFLNRTDQTWTKPSSFFVGVPHIYTHWHFLKNCIDQDRISYAAVTALSWTFLLNTQKSYLTFTKFNGSWVTLQSSFFSIGSLGNRSAFLEKQHYGCII